MKELSTKESRDLFIETFKLQLQRGLLLQHEKPFAESILRYREVRGDITENQYLSIRKLVIRIIGERNHSKTFS